VLDLGAAETETSACRFEHCLSEEVAGSICTLLGHPRTCPHGKPIPPGPCCHVRDKAPSPVIVPLSDLEVGQRARVAYIVSHRDHRLDRLTSLGLLPGAHVRLAQRSPSFIISVGESELALAASIAHEIYVRPSGRYLGARDHMGRRRRFSWRGRRWE
jgi:DtxR family Mn-dependent transcriptional regulator